MILKKNLKFQQMIQKSKSKLKLLKKLELLMRLGLMMSLIRLMMS